jgi:GGDEF domain-containing protein
MTMDEIEKLATELERHAQADVRTGRSPEDRHPARIAARAALLRAVEGIVRERDRAESALVARHGGEPLALLAELDEARARAEAAEKERDRLLAERDAANATAQRIAERLTAAESALAAMRREVEDRRDRWLSADPAPSPFDAGTLRLAGTELRLMLARLAASPPTAALSTETEVKL